MEKKSSKFKYKDLKITVKVGDNSSDVRELRVGEDKPKPLNFKEFEKHSSAGLDALDRLKRNLYLLESEKVEVQVSKIFIASFFKINSLNPFHHTFKLNYKSFCYFSSAIPFLMYIFQLSDFEHKQTARGYYAKC